jgi:hypothetical protein
MSKSNPDHYKFGKVEVIDITKFLDFPLGNVVKYAARAGRKEGESKLDDLYKAKVYLDTAIEMAIESRAASEAKSILQLNDEYRACREVEPDLSKIGRRINK